MGMVEKIALEADITKAAAERALKAITNTITETLADGEVVSLVGFGTFRVQPRAGRTGRNPKTGEPIEIMASKIANFKPGKILKDSCNR